MNRAIGLALLAGGIVLLIFGIQAANSFSSNVSKVFSGSPTNNSVWMIVLGAILAIVGLVMSFGGGRGTRV
ncbi:MAG: rane protein [Pedosphaera sp.]|nr:rane protein [Pedosphaera sp.]